MMPYWGRGVSKVVSEIGGFEVEEASDSTSKQKLSKVRNMLGAVMQFVL